MNFKCFVSKNHPQKRRSSTSCWSGRATSSCRDCAMVRRCVVSHCFAAPAALSFPHPHPAPLTLSPPRTLASAPQCSPIGLTTLLSLLAMRCCVVLSSNPLCRFARFHSLLSTLSLSLDTTLVTTPFPPRTRFFHHPTRTAALPLLPFFFPTVHLPPVPRARMLFFLPFRRSQCESHSSLLFCFVSRSLPNEM